MSEEEGNRPVKRVKVEETVAHNESETESACLTNEDGDSYFAIGSNRRCTVRKWKKAVLVDIREFYEKGGKELPGRKGISLSQSDYETFQDLITSGKIQEHIKALQTHDADIINKGDCKVNEEGEPIFDLSSTKKCTIRKWRGTIYTDIREFYEKNGQSLPGKKGISLSVQEFEQLKDVIDELSKKVTSLGGESKKENTKKEESDVKLESGSEIPQSQSKTGDFSKNGDGDAYFELSSNRRCTIRKWKGKVLFDIREFYEKNSKHLPGKKGISLSKEQYESFRDSMNKIKSQIQSLEGGKTDPSSDNLKTNDDGDVFFELSSDKRCTVRQWRNSTLIDIRQMYEKDGKAMPGRQGISLSKDQYEILHNTIQEGKVDQHIQSL